MRARRLASLLASTFFIGHAGCGRKVPNEVRPVIDAQRSTALKVVEEVAKICPAAKARAPFNPSPIDAPLPPANPAKGTSLEAEPKVLNVFVRCSWPDPRNAAVMAGTSLSPLRPAASQARVHPVTKPADIVEQTCPDKPHDCHQIIAPSRYTTLEKSADLRLVRPTADGGEAEVEVVFAVR